MIPGTVRLRRRRDRRPRPPAARQAERRQAPRRRPLADPRAEAPGRPAGACSSTSAACHDLAYVRDAGDTSRSAPSPATRLRERAAPAGALPDREPHGGADRRPAGPSPRHDRRLARTRRPGLRPPGGDARARRRAGRSRRATASVSSRRPTSSRTSSRRQSAPPRCSPRSGCRSSATRPAGPTSKAQPARSGLGNRRRRRDRPAHERHGRQRRDRPRQHGRHPATGERSGSGAGRRTLHRRRRRAPRRGNGAARRLGGSSAYRAHLVTVIGRRALEEALSR